MRPRCLVALVLLIPPVMIWIDAPAAAWVASQEIWPAGSAAFSGLLVLPATAAAVAAVLVALTAPDRSARRRSADPAPRPGRAATPVLVAAVASLAAAALLKHLIGRARPSAAGGDPWRFEPLAFDDRFAALPSAQAACLAAIVLGLAVEWPRWRLPLVMGGAAACLARVTAGAHWPSDVIAGWGLGAAMVLVTQLGLVRRQRRAGLRRR